VRDRARAVDFGGAAGRGSGRRPGHDRRRSAHGFGRAAPARRAARLDRPSSRDPLWPLRAADPAAPLQPRGRNARARQWLPGARAAQDRMSGRATVMTTPNQSTTLRADASTPAPTSGAPQASPEPVRDLPPLPEDALIILPVRNLVLFPGTVAPIG